MASDAEQAQLSLPSTLGERIPSASGLGDLEPFLLGFNVVEGAHFQALRARLLENPIHLPLGFFSRTRLELGCDHEFAAKLADFRDGAGQTIRFAAPVQVPDAALDRVVDIVNFQPRVAAGRHAETRHGREVLC